MMAPPPPGLGHKGLLPATSGLCLPKDEGFLTDSFGLREEVEKDVGGDGVGTDLLCCHGQVAAPVWASVFSLEEGRNFEC